MRTSTRDDSVRFWGSRNLRGLELLAVAATCLFATSQSAFAADLEVGAGETYTTVQSAVDAAAASGDTIHIAAGTYTEVGQISIQKDLTITGAGKTATIVKPSADTAGSKDDAGGWIVVGSGHTVNISDLALDGTGRKVRFGIIQKGSGSVENVAFDAIQYEPGGSGAAYQGNGLWIDGPGNVDVTGCTFADMGRVGVLADHGTGRFSGNTYTGKGIGDWLDYAFTVEYGFRAVIDGNTVTDCRGIAYDGSSSAAVAVWDDPDTEATVTNNTFTGNGSGIGIVVISGGSNDPVVNVGPNNVITGSESAVSVNASDALAAAPTIAITGSSLSDNVDGLYIDPGLSTSNISVHGSTLTGNTGLAVNNEGTGVLDATGNWWGSANGPYNADTNPLGTGDKVSSNVAYTPFASRSTFKEIVTATAGSHGAISPSGAQSVAFGADAAFTMAPDAGYYISSLSVDGSAVTPATSYTFTNVTSDHTIAATFAINTYTLTYTAGTGGSIEGSSTQVVDSGAPGTAVTATPAIGHHFVSWSDGVLTAVRTDSNVTGDVSVTADFAVTTYTIAPSAGAHGSISPATAQTVTSGDSKTFTITPDSGYHIADVLVNGKSVGAVGSYEFTNVTADGTISATFSQSLSALKLTIASDRAISTRGHAVKFSGTTSPNVPNGTKLSFQIRKLGSTKWTTVSVRSTFSSHHWSYTLSTKNRKHGAYFFRVKYAGTAYLGAVSPSKKLSIK